MGRRPHPDSLYSKIIEVLKEHPNFNSNQVAVKLGIPRAKVAPGVTRYRQSLLTTQASQETKQILVQALASKRALEIIKGAAEPGKRPPPTEDDISRIRDAALDPEKRMQMIADIAARGDDAVALRALVEIHDLQLQSGTLSTLPPPTSDAEQVARASRILEALGRVDAQRAWDLAFTPKAAPSEAEAPDTLPEDSSAVPLPQ